MTAPASSIAPVPPTAPSAIAAIRGPQHATLARPWATRPRTASPRGVGGAAGEQAPVVAAARERAGLRRGELERAGGEQAEAGDDRAGRGRRPERDDPGEHHEAEGGPRGEEPCGDEARGAGPAREGRRCRQHRRRDHQPPPDEPDGAREGRCGVGGVAAGGTVVRQGAPARAGDRDEDRRRQRRRAEHRGAPAPRVVAPPRREHPNLPSSRRNRGVASVRAPDGVKARGGPRRPQTPAASPNDLMPPGPGELRASRGMLELDGLTKRYGARVALDGLTFSVPPGQVVGLLGPNGSGKTTAMRIVFGVIPADAGEVRYQGVPLGVEQRRRFGYMPEERGLYPDMRVRDQLVYFARLSGVGADDAGRRDGRPARAPRPDGPGGGRRREAVARQPAARAAGRGPGPRARRARARRALLRARPARGGEPLGDRPGRRPRRAHRPVLQPPARPGGGPVRVGGGDRPRPARDGGARRAT